MILIINKIKPLITQIALLLFDNVLSRKQNSSKLCLKITNTALSLYGFSYSVNLTFVSHINLYFDYGTVIGLFCSTDCLNVLM